MLSTRRIYIIYNDQPTGTPASSKKSWFELENPVTLSRYLCKGTSAITRECRRQYVSGKFTGYKAVNDSVVAVEVQDEHGAKLAAKGQELPN